MKGEVPPAGSARAAYIGIFIISCASLALEITFTRILSVITWYYLAYFAISLALLGITAGAITVYLNDSWFDENKLESTLARASFAFSWITPISLLLLCLIPIVSGSLELQLMPLCSLLFVSIACALPFYFSGMVITALLTRSPFSVAKIYAADLLGAAFACIFVIYGLGVMDAPSLILATGAVGGISTLFFANRSRAPALRKFALCSCCFLLAMALLNSRSHRGIRPLFVKGQMDNPREYLAERWNTLSRVAVTHLLRDSPQYWGPSPKAPTNIIEQYWLNIDGSAGTNLRRFASLGDIDHLRYDVSNIGYYLTGGGQACIIGVGGARDIQSAILFKHAPVIGIDINPIFIQLLQKDFAAFAGVANRSDVTLVIDEGRSYLTRSREEFAIIQMSLVDTWAATGAGAFTLSENALYTVEAWEVFYQHLAPNGIFTVSRWHNPNDVSETGRLVSLAVATLLELGIRQPASHIILVGTNNLATLLVSKRPFGPAQIAELKLVTDRLQFSRILLPSEPSYSPVLRKIAESKSIRELQMVASESPLNLSAPSDESPYFFNMLKLTEIGYVLSQGQGIAAGNFVATIFLAGLIVVLIVLVVMVVIVPLLVKHRRSLRAVVGRRGFLAGAAYFSLIGAGFMFTEVAIMQRMSIFLGHPVYALVVLLLTITLSTGCGSFLSEYLPKRSRSLLFAYPVVIAVSVFLLRLFLTYLHRVAITYERWLKILITIGSVFPVGLLMGICFPLGMYLVSRNSNAQTPWYWALNGIFGVLASTMAIFTSIYFGISTTFYFAASCYLLLLLCNLSLKREIAIAEKRWSDIHSLKHSNERDFV